jgi:hypothetical protein
MAWAAATVVAQGDPFVGTFHGDGLTVRLSGSGGRYTGDLQRADRQFPAQAVWTGSVLSGTFESEGHHFPFTATVKAGVMTLVTGRTTYTLRQAAAAAPGPTPGPRALPSGYQLVNHQIGSGQIIVAAFPQAQSARRLGRQAFDALARYFDARPRPGGGLADQEDQRVEMMFEISHGGAAVTGVMLSRVHGGRGAVGLAFDHAERAPRTLTPLLRGLEQAMPITGPVEETRWENLTLPDGSGTLRAPIGFRITGASQGAVDVAGPAGEIVSLGQAYPVVTPEGTVTAIGTRLEYPLVAPITDPATALRNMIPQLARFTRQINPNAPVVQLTRIIEGQETPWANGRAAFMHTEALLYTGPQPVTYQAITLVAVMPIDQTQWLFYFSSAGAPVEVFRTQIGDLLQVWQSWKVADHVFRQRMQAAMQSMRETHKLMQDAHANRQKAFAKANAQWGEYIRGKGTIVNPTTGQQHQVPLHQIQQVQQALNQQAGYQKWQVLPPGDG